MRVVPIQQARKLFLPFGKAIVTAVAPVGISQHVFSLTSLLGVGKKCDGLAFDRLAKKKG
jgi:hypothetical protein